MPPTPPAARALLLAAALLAPALAAAAVEEEAPIAETPTLYKWVDTNGVAHYTTDLQQVPRSLRRGARQLGPSTGSAPSAAPARATRSGGAGSGTTEADRWSRTDRPRVIDDGWGGSEEDWDEGGANPGPSYAEVEARLRQIDAEIQVLEADIAADEEVLKRYVAAPPPQDPAEVAYDVAFREVAERLPRMLSELRTLQDERAGLETP